MARNEKVFNDIQPKLDETVFAIKLRTLFWLKVTKDDWRPLVDECVRCGKVNVDGASKDELAGCGGVLRCEVGVL
ncbi:hypothetical protein V6N12_051856 [Hibiscus sabdariffa]|uniref:Integrase zinc-binding domain-containing protein n=1 Tax=Hibiscus sabdariffa TaxID=183260 RepID=A0ABR2GGJ3_9ROSI